MPAVVLCQDGIETLLELTDGLYIVLRVHDDGTLGRFPIDLSELRGVLAGDFSFQASDGAGSSVSIEEGGGLLKVRLEARGRGTKQCRLDPKTVTRAIETLESGV